MKYFLFILFLLPTCAIAQQTICIGSVRNYSVDLNENNGNGTTGSTYNWSVNGPNFQGTITNITSSGNQISIDWSTTPVGNYTLNVSEVNNNNCKTNQTLNVRLVNKPTVDLNDVYVCVRNNVWINNPIFNTNLNPNLYTFRWFFNNTLLPDTTSSLIPTQVGTYKVIVTNIVSGCEAEDSAEVILSTPIIAQISTTEDFSDNPQITINATGGVPPYQYSIDGNVPQTSNIFMVNDSGKYTITISDATGCQVTEICTCIFLYDKFFTPNGDGYNDTWNIKIPRNLKNTMVSIYDRYGKIIKLFNPIRENWDGTYNNKKLFSSDYWFKVDYEDCNGEKKVFKSHFTLKR